MDPLYRCVPSCRSDDNPLTRSVLACAVVGFLLCAIPKIHYQIILVSTAFVGATAFMLGVDCYTTTNLKEVRDRRLVCIQQC